MHQETRIATTVKLKSPLAPANITPVSSEVTKKTNRQNNTGPPTRNRHSQIRKDISPPQRDCLDRINTVLPAAESLTSSTCPTAFVVASTPGVVDLKPPVFPVVQGGKHQIAMNSPVIRRFSPVCRFAEPIPINGVGSIIPWRKTGHPYEHRSAVSAWSRWAASNLATPSGSFGSSLHTNAGS